MVQVILNCKAVFSVVMEQDAKKRSIKLQLWDTAGQERYRSLVPSYLRGAHVILFVYDVLNPQSYQDMLDILSSLKDRIPPGAVLYALGNKVDKLGAFPELGDIVVNVPILMSPFLSCRWTSWQVSALLHSMMYLPSKMSPVVTLTRLARE